MSMKAGALKNLWFIEPMKALPVEKLPEGDWIYEIKHDGYRALAYKDGKDVRLISLEETVWPSVGNLYLHRSTPMTSSPLSGTYSTMKSGSGQITTIAS